VATTSVRWAVTKHLVDLIRANPDLAGVRVEPGYPGDEAGAEAIWVYGLDGELSIPLMQAGRKQRDDRFEIPFQVAVSLNANLDTTFQRLTEIVAAIEDVLADDPSLGGIDGVIAAEITSERLSCGPSRQLYMGVAEVVVSVHARLH
jgi:hypothetical protein